MSKIACEKCGNIMFENVEDGKGNKFIITGTAPKQFSDEKGSFYICENCKSKYRHISNETESGLPGFYLELED
jgi:Zn finger protein HypA/HybF involved in hydrogenase expression